MKEVSIEFTRSQHSIRDQQHHHRQIQQPEQTRCEWDFNLATTISSAAKGPISDTIGAIEFDPSDRLFATAGIARKIRFYSLNSSLPAGTAGTGTILTHSTACDFYICAPAKLSSLKWRPNSGGNQIIAAGDYDGVVTEYDLHRRSAVFERDEHSGRRVWTIDYSIHNSSLAASGSDDGTAQIWDPRCGSTTIASIFSGEPKRNSICSVQFDPDNSPMFAVGSADCNAYIFDLRNLSKPYTTLSGHQKTVTYVKFFRQGLLVSSSIDGFLKLWDLRDSRERKCYSGHRNTRSFVGLSIWRNGGLFGCGSETNEVFVYDHRWSEPVKVCQFEPRAGFVSSVCWNQTGNDGQDCTLVAGGSDGDLQIFRGKKRESLVDDYSFGISTTV